jgi:DNA methylase
MDRRRLEELRAGIHDREPVSGLTHGFYRYPARFSPAFARAAIEAFTTPGDVVLDPFVGGGTTLVEARAAGRVGIGTDISSLAVFVSRVKLDVLSERDLKAVRRWSDMLVGQLNLRRPTMRSDIWLSYQRNISGRSTWPIRKLIEMALATRHRLGNEAQVRFAQAALLKTAQWALDCHSRIPKAEEFRRTLAQNIEEMVEGARSFRLAAAAGDRLSRTECQPRSVLLNRSAVGLQDDQGVIEYGPPRLVLTSPPYPGVHVVYHRWQVLGRLETPAPFWIANSPDGNGLSHYTFADRRRKDMTPYFDGIRESFRSVASLADSRTTVVQMVAFAEPSSHLPAYLKALRNAGLREVKVPGLANASDGRVWRIVPNRKWYARQRGAIAASNEAVLFHRRA